MGDYKLCIIKPNKLAYSETFIQSHIDHLKGDKVILYGGGFPLYKPNDELLIDSKIDFLSYIIQKRIFKRLSISVRTKALARYLHQERVQLVLAEYGYVGALVTEACQLASIPLIIHFHGADAHHTGTVEKYKSLYTKAFNYASAIIVVSQDMLTAVTGLGAKQNKVVLNPYGVNVNVFKPAPVLNSGVNFLAVGRFVHKKSPLTTISSFGKVLEKFPDAHLWMVGDGPLLNEAKLLAKALQIAQHITFTGVLPHAEIVSLMQKMRCFVQHSVTANNGDMEGTPNTILEASASGLPVVSTRHAGIKEAVIENKTGFLVTEHDVETMSSQMLKLASSAELAAELGKNGREHVLINYNISQQIGKLDKLIAQTIKGR